MKKILALVAVSFAVAACGHEAERHPDHEDCWVISDARNDGYVTTACEVELDR